MHEYRKLVGVGPYAPHPRSSPGDRLPDNKGRWEGKGVCERGAEEGRRELKRRGKKTEISVVYFNDVKGRLVRSLHRTFVLPLSLCPTPPLPACPFPCRIWWTLLIFIPLPFPLQLIVSLPSHNNRQSRWGGRSGESSHKLAISSAWQRKWPTPETDNAPHVGPRWMALYRTQREEPFPLPNYTSVPCLDNRSIPDTDNFCVIM